MVGGVVGQHEVSWSGAGDDEVVLFLFLFGLAVLARLRRQPLVQVARQLIDGDDAVGLVKPSLSALPLQAFEER